MNKNKQLNNVCYLSPSEADELWGVTVTTVGCESIKKAELYPPQKHPAEYQFKLDKGRVLNEYQLLYITKGHGILTFGETKQKCQIGEGNMILLMPGVWHSYAPIANSDWKEYWIGFKGYAIQNITDNGLFDGRPPVFSIGLNECVVDLYCKALEIANEKKSNYQNLLGGIVLHMIGLMLYQDSALKPNECDLVEKVDKSKILMRESIYKNICPKEIAMQLNISYSGFRRAFKSITGTAPLQYILDLKLHEAKKLLVNSPLSIKEISYTLNFDTPDYFTVFFKKRTNLTPLEYRYAHSNSKTKPVFLSTVSSKYQLARVN